MGCCGQHRAELKRTLTITSLPKPSANPVSGTPVVPETGSARLRYARNGAILVRGPVSGRVYEFGTANPECDVDLRDAEVLLRTDLFRRSGAVQEHVS